jgi:hypothetical protein
LSKRASGDFAAAFAFAGVFAFATHVAGVATALAFAAVHALAIVLAHACVGGGGFAGVIAGASGNGQDGTGDQTGHSSGDDKGSRRSIHNIALVLYCLRFRFFTETGHHAAPASEDMSRLNSKPYNSNEMS